MSAEEQLKILKDFVEETKKETQKVKEVNLIAEAKAAGLPSQTDVNTFGDSFFDGMDPSLSFITYDLSEEVYTSFDVARRLPIAVGQGAMRSASVAGLPIVAALVISSFVQDFTELPFPLNYIAIMGAILIGLILGAAQATSEARLTFQDMSETKELVRELDEVKAEVGEALEAYNAAAKAYNTAVAGIQSIVQERNPDQSGELKEHPVADRFSRFVVSASRVEIVVDKSGEQDALVRGTGPSYGAASDGSQ